MTDRRWQTVTCSDCGRTYLCTPDDDYYNETEAGDDGCCFACLLKRNGYAVVDLLTCTTTNHGRVKWNGGNVVCLSCGSYLCWAAWAIDYGTEAMNEQRRVHPGGRPVVGDAHRCGKSSGHNTTSDTEHECSCGTTW